jgi:hypothetical protein
MKEPQIKTSGKRMEMAEDFTPAEVVGAAVIEDVPGIGPGVFPIVSDEPRPWHLMDNAPQDGTMIEVKEDPEDPDVSAVMVRYYHTSVRDRARRKWVPAAWWRNALTAERLSFEPFCWRMPDGFTQPGMIVA